MTDRPYLIAGGGIAGLAAALGLARIGRPGAVFEQAPAFDEVGAGLQMSPNGVRALQWLGAWEAVEPACVVPTEIHLRDGQSGALLQRIRLGKPFEDRFGAPYRVCHRADLLAGLVAAAGAAPGITLQTDCRAIAMKSVGDGASLTLEDGRTMTGTAVVAADGLRSVLRQTICGVVEPAYQGHTIYRALLPFSAVPGGIEADCVTLWLYPGGHVVHYPVSNWRNFNIVATIDSPAPAGGWSTPAETRDLRLAFAEADDALLDLIGAPTTWLKWPGADLPDLPGWCASNLVLVGDAAHATLPYLAQGAVMALEDACVLAGKLAEFQAPAEAFQDFERTRRPRTSRIQAQSRRQGSHYHARGIAPLVRNAALKLAGQQLALRRTGWIYEWAPEM